MATRLIALLAISFSVLAADDGPSPAQQADWQQRLDKAAALQAESRTRQDEADRILDGKATECFKKFRVNACRDDARVKHQLSTREARRLDIQGKALEREVKKEQFSDKDKRRAEAAPQQEADLKAREAETSAARQSTEAELAATQADKAKKAEEGAKRKAAEAEKQRKKREDHDAKVAAKMQQAERRAAEVEKK
ncbi:MAG: hypothetical protein Q8S26_05555 [Azonexus sp.]|nr:hypothetical protein [Azonexus sp.]